MSAIKTHINNFQSTLGKAKELINRVSRENSAWIHLGIDHEEVDNAEKLLQDIQIKLALISDSVNKFSSATVPDEIKIALLRKGLHVAFSDLSTIYHDLKQIKKEMQFGSGQEMNVKHLKLHFTLFENHCQKIKEQLDETLARN